MDGVPWAQTHSQEWGQGAVGTDGVQRARIGQRGHGSVTKCGVRVPRARTHGQEWGQGATWGMQQGVTGGDGGSWGGHRDG